MTDRYQRVESLVDDLNAFERETGLRLDLRDGKARDAETREVVARLGYDGEQFTVRRPGE